MFSNNNKIILSVLAIFLVSFGISAVFAEDEGSCENCSDDNLCVDHDNNGHTACSDRTCTECDNGLKLYCEVENWYRVLNNDVECLECDANGEMICISDECDLPTIRIDNKREAYCEPCYELIELNTNLNNPTNNGDEGLSDSNLENGTDDESDEIEEETDYQEDSDTNKNEKQEITAISEVTYEYVESEDDNVVDAGLKNTGLPIVAVLLVLLGLVGIGMKRRE